MKSNYYEEKFRSIKILGDPIKSPSPDRKNSNIIAPTLSPDSFHLNRKATAQQLQINTQNINTKEQKLSYEHRTEKKQHSKTPTNIRAKHEFDAKLVESRQVDSNQFKKVIQEKEDIINELKTIIKIQSENNQKSRIKGHLFQHQEDRHDNDVKQLAYKNQKLLDFITKFKQGHHFNEQAHIQIQVKQSQNGSIVKIQHLRVEMQKLKDFFKQKENKYQKQIDELIKSHKSLALECKKMQIYKQELEKENERILKILKEKGQQKRNLFKEEEKNLRNNSFEKLSIIKIKEQYQQSLKQFKQTIAIQVENLFETLRFAFQQLNSKVQKLQGQLYALEYSFHMLNRLNPKFITHDLKKNQQIYILEDEIEQNQRQKQGKVLNSIQTQEKYKKRIIQLELQNQELKHEINFRTQNYTFREKQCHYHQETIESYRHQSQAKDQQLYALRTQRDRKEHQLLIQINSLRQQIDFLQKTYKKQKDSNERQWENRCHQKDEVLQTLLNQIETLKQTLQGYEEQKIQMKIKINNVIIQKLKNEELKQQNSNLLIKLQQYKKLCQLLKSETEQNSIETDIFDEMKRQVKMFKEKYERDQIVIKNLDSQNKQICKANTQLRFKVQSSMIQFSKLQIQSEDLKKKLLYEQKDREELATKISLLENNIKILQLDIKAKVQFQEQLIRQKQILSKQMLNYLSIFNKIPHEKAFCNQLNGDLNLEQLLNNIEKIQSSFNIQQSSRREKQVMLRIIESSQISEIKYSQKV